MEVLFSRRRGGQVVLACESAGLGRVTVAEFESDLKNNLYKIWLCRVGDYAEWVVLGASPSSSGVQAP